MRPRKSIPRYHRHWLNTEQYESRIVWIGQGHYSSITSVMVMPLPLLLTIIKGENIAKLQMLGSRQQCIASGKRGQNRENIVRTFQLIYRWQKTNSGAILWYRRGTYKVGKYIKTSQKVLTYLLVMTVSAIPLWVCEDPSL